MRKTGPSKTVVDLVIGRSGGGCERCGGTGEQVHHRTPRGMGGSRLPAINAPSNLVHLCGDCHQEVESNREAALVYGWLVRRGWPPADVAIKRFDGEWLLLDDAGNYVRLPPEAGWDECA